MYQGGKSIRGHMEWAFHARSSTVDGELLGYKIVHQTGKSHAGQYLQSHEQNLVIESGGRPRHFVGRAYLLNEFPAGVSENDIKQ